MQLWRINLKPDSEAGTEAAAFCIAQGIVGIGWGLEPSMAWPTTKDEYWKAAQSVYANNGKTSLTRAANAILHRMQTDDLVWTRNPHGQYFLGRIASDWRYAGSPEHTAADIFNVRTCVWLSVGPADNVPGKVVSSFGPSATVQVVDDRSSELYSMYLFNRFRKEPVYALPVERHVDLLNLLSAQDLEDVVGIYLQIERECVIYPSSCKNDTQFIEYLLWSLRDNIRVGVQVKSGHLSLNMSDYSDFDGHVYLFAASGRYEGLQCANVTCLSPQMIRDFILMKRSVMPCRIRRWVDLALELAADGDRTVIASSQPELA